MPSPVPSLPKRMRGRGWSLRRWRQACRRVIAVAAGQWIVDAWRPAFLLKSSQDLLLVLGGLAEALDEFVAEAELAADGVPDRYAVRAGQRQGAVGACRAGMAHTFLR